MIDQKSAFDSLTRQADTVFCAVNEGDEETQERAM
jgi:hypothetical protein